MTVGDQVAEDWAVEINGSLFSRSMGVEVVSLDWLRSPDIRSQSFTRPMSHGAFSSNAYWGARTFELELEVFSNNDTELASLVTRLLQATNLGEGEVPVVVQVPGWGKLVSWARPERRSGPIFDKEYDLHVARIALGFRASDPRLYHAECMSATIPIGLAASTGLQFDVTPSIVFGAGGVSRVRNAKNEGTTDTYPVVKIHGPITNPELLHLGSGKSLKFQCTLADTEFLELDFMARSVRLNGDVNRYGWVEDSTGWWSLAPGDNEIILNGITTGTPYAIVEWRSALI